MSKAHRTAPAGRCLHGVGVDHLAQPQHVRLAVLLDVAADLGVADSQQHPVAAVRKIKAHAAFGARLAECIGKNHGITQKTAQKQTARYTTLFVSGKPVSGCLFGAFG